MVYVTQFHLHLTQHLQWAKLGTVDHLWTIDIINDLFFRYGAQPWQVIMYDLSNNFIGGGALIDPSNVLTAAHKVVGRVPGTIKVRLGDWDVTRPIEPYPPQEQIVAQIRIHPLFNQTVPVTMNNLQNNVAILRLASPIVFNNPAINTICLPPSNTTVYDGQR